MRRNPCPCDAQMGTVPRQTIRSDQSGLHPSVVQPWWLTSDEFPSSHAHDPFTYQFQGSFSSTMSSKPHVVNMQWQIDKSPNGGIVGARRQHRKQRKHSTTISKGAAQPQQIRRQPLQALAPALQARDSDQRLPRFARPSRVLAPWNLSDGDASLTVAFASSEWIDSSTSHGTHANIPRQQETQLGWPVASIE